MDDEARQSNVRGMRGRGIYVIEYSLSPFRFCSWCAVALHVASDGSLAW